MNIQDMDHNYELKHKKRLIKRKKKRRLRIIKLFLLTVLLIGGLTFLTMSPLFNIKSIEAAGSTRYTQEALISASGLGPGINAFKAMGKNIKGIIRLRYISAEKSILQAFPYVKNTEVRYAIPGKIMIKVEEREPSYILVHDNSNFLIDLEGNLLEESADIKNIKLPFIRGIKYESFTPGQAPGNDNKKKLKLVSTLYETLAEEDKTDNFKIVPLLNYIDVTDTDKVCIMIDSRIIINFGDLEDLNYRIRFARQVFQKNLTKQDKGTLDFSSGEKGIFKPG